MIFLIWRFIASIALVVYIALLMPSGNLNNATIPHQTNDVAIDQKLQDIFHPIFLLKFCSSLISSVSFIAETADCLGYKIRLYTPVTNQILFQACIVLQVGQPQAFKVILSISESFFYYSTIFITHIMRSGKSPEYQVVTKNSC